MQNNIISIPSEDAGRIEGFPLPISTQPYQIISMVKWLFVPFVSLSLPFVVFILIFLHCNSDPNPGRFETMVNHSPAIINLICCLTTSALIAFVMIWSELKKSAEDRKIRKIIKNREIIFSKLGLYLSTIDFDPENFGTSSSAYRYINWTSIAKWLVTKDDNVGNYRISRYLVYFTDGSTHEFPRWAFTDIEKIFLTKLEEFIPGKVDSNSN